jgi:predicted Zn-ribbon and HTH transcriptional regulator
MLYCTVVSKEPNRSAPKTLDVSTVYEKYIKHVKKAFRNTDSMKIIKALKCPKLGFEGSGAV